MPDATLSTWIGRTERQIDWVVPSRVAAWHATLDHDVSFPDEGDAVPPAIYWTLFPPVARTSALSEDGHGKRGTFLPPVELPRRLWAGSRLTVDRPLRIGERVTRESTIARIEEKEGSQGPLVFVTVRHIVRAGGDRVLEEEQDLVYRNPSPRAALRAASVATPPAHTWERTIQPTEALLFRYSALTFNGHRIHYDRPYAQFEGYPGLVVHGPLIATLLLDLVQSNMNDATMERFTFKAMRPAFDGAPLTLRGAPAADSKSIDLWSVASDGGIGVEATAWIR